MTTLEELRGFLLKSRLISGDHQISADDSLLESGLIDSLGIFELVTYLREEHGVQVLDIDLVPENFDSLNAILAFIKGQEGGHARGL